MKKVEIMNERVAFDDFFKIEEARLKFELQDGTMSNPVRRLNFNRGDSAAALVFNTQTNEVLLVNQFKYPTYKNEGGWITEVVAGMIDELESPEEAIKREVLEETGFRVRKLTDISVFYVSPGGSSERIFLFCAEVTSEDRIEEGGGCKNENEDIEIRKIPISRLWEMLERGKLNDAKTIIAVMWLNKKLERKT